MTHATTYRGTGLASAFVLICGLAAGCTDIRLQRVDELGLTSYRVPPQVERSWNADLIARIQPGVSDPPSAGAAPYHECDSRAADPMDPNRVADGMPMERIAGKLTIRVCGIAVDDFPGELRFAYQLARAYASNGNTAEAIPLLKRAAKQDYAAAQEALGAIYLAQGSRDSGLNMKPAVRWIARAAENGSITSQWLLGNILADGLAVKRDMPAALRWLRKAGQRGHTRAMTAIGKIHLNNPHVPQDRTKAADWLKRAADEGEPEAQFILALLYRKGIGVEANEDAAIAMIRNSAENGHPMAQARLGAELLGVGEMNEHAPEGYFWLKLAERAEVGTVAGLIDYALDNLTQPERETVEAALADWRPSKPAPETVLALVQQEEMKAIDIAEGDADSQSSENGAPTAAVEEEGETIEDAEPAAEQAVASTERAEMEGSSTPVASDLSVANLTDSEERSEASTVTLPALRRLDALFPDGESRLPTDAADEAKTAETAPDAGEDAKDDGFWSFFGIRISKGVVEGALNGEPPGEASGGDAALKATPIPKEREEKTLNSANESPERVAASPGIEENFAPKRGETAPALTPRQTTAAHAAEWSFFKKRIPARDGLPIPGMSSSEIEATGPDAPEAPLANGENDDVKPVSAPRIVQKTVPVSAEDLGSSDRGPNPGEMRIADSAQEADDEAEDEEDMHLEPPSSWTLFGIKIPIEYE